MGDGVEDFQGGVCMDIMIVYSSRLKVVKHPTSHLRISWPPSE